MDRTSRVLLVTLLLALLLALLPALACETTAPTPPRVAAPLPLPDAGVTHETFTLVSKVLGEARRINVYTPPGYADAPGASFPIVYMPDGGEQEDFPHVTETIDAAVRAHAMRGVIVVGIENTERRRDMTGPTQVESDRKIAPRVGGSANFRAFIRDELMPTMRGRVRGDGTTAIVGESLAGLFVVETFLHEPQLFDTYIAISPSLWWNDRELVRRAATSLKGPGRPARTLFLTVAGDDDRNDAIAAFAGVLKTDAPPGLTWFFEPMPSEHHDTIYRASSPRAFRRLFPPVATPVR